ncbi:MAG TPA: hypothetical protein VKB57_01720 [Acidimicrobiales bacterium]|nr:hypothetical protein [Acidimicrobiales bacterium]
MAMIPDIDRPWPDALVDLGPIELTEHYWGIVGTIPYEGHVVLAIVTGPRMPGRSRP